MPLVASKLTRVELDEDRTITTGSTRVHHILVCNASASNVEVTFIDNASATLLTIAVLANSSFGHQAVFIVNNGLLVNSASDADVSVTVAHSADGA